MLKKSTFINKFWGTSSTVGKKVRKEAYLLILKINGGLLSKEKAKYAISLLYLLKEGHFYSKIFF